MTNTIFARARAAVLAGDRDAGFAALTELDRTGMMTAASDGDPNLIVVSLDDLWRLIEVVRIPKTFGEALREIGFKPATGARIATRLGSSLPRSSDSDPE
jgi:hypothetical protein